MRLLLKFCVIVVKMTCEDNKVNNKDYDQLENVLGEESDSDT
jgi:hypothetical protein